MSYSQVADHQWVDLRDNQPDYAVLLRSDITLVEAHINPEHPQGEYNGTAVHVYVYEGPLSAPAYVRTIEAPELEGLALENRKVPQAVWDRLQAIAEKEEVSNAQSE